MRLSPPKVVVFWISVILAAIGFLSFLGIIPIAVSTGFWALVIGFVLLTLGCLLKDFQDKVSLIQLKEKHRLNQKEIVK